MIALLILIPLCGGIISFLIKKNSIRRLLLAAVACTHLALTLSLWTQLPFTPNDNWFQFDSLSLLFLTITSLLFFAAALYANFYLKKEEKNHEKVFEEGLIFKNIPEAFFTACLLLFLSTMTMVASSQHFGMLWIAMEATTLVSAPLIYFHRNDRSLEATWKYLLICSVGIALALLGNLFLLVASPDRTHPFLINEWRNLGPLLNPEWLKAAFLLFFVGYGTKMGLSPMHTWLPDAHSEAPSLVSSLLSGALLNCAFLSLLRVYQVCIAAGLKAFAQEIFLTFGIISIIIAAIFILRQIDFKRMLAYSTIEHMGILAVGIGIGKEAVFGSLFHVVNHSLTKSVLFLVAGNIIFKYKSKLVDQVGSMNRLMPISGVLWILGFLSITGCPPFGTFLSKFIILKTVITEGHYVIAFLILAFLTIIFMGMASIFFSMFQKKDEIQDTIRIKEKPLSILGPILFIGCLLILGLYQPPFLKGILENASQLLETL
jgi:hydrogenase-4 component F